MDTLFATTKPHYINVKKVDVTEISHIHLIWLREPDLNRRPPGYEFRKERDLPYFII